MKKLEGNQISLDMMSHRKSAKNCENYWGNTGAKRKNEVDVKRASPLHPKEVPVIYGNREQPVRTFNVLFW